MSDGRKDVLLLTEMSTLQKGKEINGSRIPKEKRQGEKKKTQRSETGYGKAEYKLVFERREVWKQRIWEKVKCRSIAGEITHGVWE